MTYILAGDIGSSSVRLALVDRQGCVIADHVAAAPPVNESADRSEVDAEDWWRILLDAAGDLAHREPLAFARIAGVALCGITRTQVLLDDAGHQICPAMTWNDCRSSGVARSLQQGYAGRHPEASQLNGFHPLARLAWLRADARPLADRLRCILDPKDYLNFRLTGRKTSDPVSLARLLAAAETVDGVDLLTAIGSSSAVLPDIIEPWQQVGPISPGLAGPFAQLAGVPVFCCSNDTWTAAAGLGALRPGYSYNISGTTEVLGVIGETPARADGLLTVDWRGLFQLGGPSQNGADTVRWLMSVLGRAQDGSAGIGAELDVLLAGQRHPQPLIFLPYLQGERVPHWDPDLRGAFIGLGRQHGPTDLAWAVLEGIAFMNRTVLARAEAATGKLVREIRIGGGGAGNPLWCQLKADICRRAVVSGVAKEPGLLGAAIVAWTGLGEFTSLAAAQDELVGEHRRHEPDSVRGTYYDRLYAIFHDAHRAIAPISHDLVLLTQDMRSN